MMSQSGSDGWGAEEGESTRMSEMEGQPTTNKKRSHLADANATTKRTFPLLMMARRRARERNKSGLSRAMEAEIHSV